MENKVNPGHGIVETLPVTNIANVKLELGVVVKFSHIVLLFFITTENADFCDVGIKEAVKGGIAEGTGPAGNEKGFVGEHNNFR
jgi:hypothetical protein